MAATDQQILDEARNSLLRILQTDTSSWSHSQQQQSQQDIAKLESLIDKYENRVAAGNGRQIFNPIRRVNV